MSEEGSGKSSRLKWLWRVMGLCAVSVAVLFGLARAFPEGALEMGPAMIASDLASEISSVGPESSSEESGFRDSQKQQVLEKVEELNADNREHMKAFLDDGWTEVESDTPPEKEVVDLDPALLNLRERDLQSQLETTRVSAANLENAGIIAMQASEHRTRTAAINAIGHRKIGEGGEVLIEIFETVTDLSERRQALAFIQSTSLESQESYWLVDQLYEPEYKGSEEFVPDLLDRLPEESHDDLEASLAKLNKRARDHDPAFMEEDEDLEAADPLIKGLEAG
ncbi:MAG: hypothetical protein JRC77_06220 [Deltaproteobacteria bacterium]|nr:hypothetical protein [Deltaproteobacteria bacterium]